MSYTTWLCASTCTATLVMVLQLAQFCFGEPLAAPWIPACFVAPAVAKLGLAGVLPTVNSNLHTQHCSGLQQ